MIYFMRFGYWVVLLKSVNLTPLLVGIKPHKRTLHMKTYRFMSTHEIGFWSRPELPTPYTGVVHHTPLTSLPLFDIQRTHHDTMSAGDQAWAFFLPCTCNTNTQTECKLLEMFTNISLILKLFRS